MIELMLRFRAEILWMNIRGKRYQSHERQALFEILVPHSDILVKQFGIDATTLVDEFDKILTKLTRGLADAVHELRQFQHDTLDRLESIARDDAGLSTDALMAKAFEDKDLTDRGSRIMG
jgi:hypothetical protein